jgi:hypothetical protein
LFAADRFLARKRKRTLGSGVSPSEATPIKLPYPTALTARRQLPIWFPCRAGPEPALRFPPTWVSGAKSL